MVLELAEAKIYGGGNPKDSNGQLSINTALTLLSYRLNFYVVHFGLAEELTSGHLRYVTDINTERTFLLTMQPSEPILSYTSAQETLRN